jgi:hypothetical protein
MTCLAPGGCCVAAAALSNSQIPLDYGRLRQVPGTRLAIFNLTFECTREPAGVGLGRLVRLVSAGKLSPRIGIEADWHDIGTIAQARIDRQFPGKAVLHL